MSGGRTLYWLLTGACLGFGVIALAGLAWPLLRRLGSRALGHDAEQR